MENVVRDVFVMSTSANLVAPSLPILLAVLSENEMNEITKIQVRSSAVRDVFDLSASANLTAPSSPILLSVLGENEMKQ
jgi:hypothetical protein